MGGGTSEEPEDMAMCQDPLSPKREEEGRREGGVSEDASRSLLKSSSTCEVSHTERLFDPWESTEVILPLKPPWPWPWLCENDVMMWPGPLEGIAWREKGAGGGRRVEALHLHPGCRA